MSLYSCCCLDTVFYIVLCFFFFKQKTAYEMRISDWSSDVCSSDLADRLLGDHAVDDQHDRRRDQQPERAGAGQRADRQRLVVAAFLQLGDADRKSVV